jgi:hypothetical protein
MTDLDAADGSALIPLPLRPGPWKSIDLDVKVGPEPKLVWSSKRVRVASATPQVPLMGSHRNKGHIEEIDLSET